MSDLTKSDIEEIIDKGLNNNETLKCIKYEISSITDYLSEYDNVFIETKYCELLIDRWLVESHESIKVQTDPHCVLEIIKTIKSVGNVTDCCKLIGTSPYNTLIDDLNNSSKFLKHLEKTCISRFKEVCLEAVFIQTSAISTEIAFVEECIELFKASKHPNEVCCGIQINDFLNGVDVCIDFRKFLDNLNSCRDIQKKYSKLKQLGYDLLKEDNFYLAQGLKDAVKSYLEPVIISETFVDGRTVLQVSGKFIILSSIVRDIEEEPRFSKIEEVRFVSSDVIHVDVDFLVTKWHGKNIVIHSNSMIVRKNNCVWNVSGHDGKDTKELGDDNQIHETTKSIVTQGNSGESGGNIMIIVNHLTGGEKLQIVSTGGNGGKGLDGKKGEDGIDGESINDRKFQNLYPPVSLFRNSGKNTNLKITHNNIRNCVKSVDHMFLNGSNLNAEHSNKAFNNTTLFEDSSQIYSLYFEITTNTGSKLQFSMYNETLTFCQSFLLYKGSAGTEGTPGSSGRKGGKGGFGGEIDVFVRNDCSSKIMKLSFQGQPGPPGKDGASGMPGKYGLDKAYMDHTLTLFGEKWPKYFFPPERDNVTLTVSYSDDKSSTKVYAPHLKKYADILPKRREIRRSCSVQSEILNKAENTSKEKSSRKKTISLESIMEMYGEIEGIVNISELSEYVGNAIEVLNEAGADEALDIERNSEEVTVTRKISFECDSFALYDWLKSLADISHIKLELKYTIKDPTLLLMQVKLNPNDLIALTNLAFVSLNLEQLNILWDVLDQANYNQSTELAIKNLNSVFFCQKYKLAVLEHLELQELGDCLTSRNSSDIILNTNALPESGLFQKTQKHDKVASYFVKDSPEKREDVVQICENFADDECVKTSIKIFLQEFGNSIAIHDKSKELVKKHVYFEQRKVDQLQQTLDMLKGELLKPKNRNLYQALVKSIIKDDGQQLAQILFQIKSIKLNLENGILNRLFSAYLRILENKNAWIGLEDNQGNVYPNIRLDFFKCIKHIGLSSRCYRNLLALHFDYNIVIFTRNAGSELVLTENLNNKSRKKVILLNEDNIYSEVEINEEMAQIITAQVSRGKKYSKTIMKIDSIAEKKDFDDFLNNMKNETESHADIAKSSLIATRVLNITTQDDDVKLIRNVFTIPDESTMVSTRLEKLKLEYSGSENILHFMALHIKSEVNTVSAKELCFVINIILQSTVQDNIMPIVSWIIAVFPHSSWLSELTLLKLETKLKKTLELDQKLRWREYITKQNDSEMLMLFYERLNGNEDSNVNVELVEEVLSLISTIPKASVGLENICLSEWKYYLKDRYWLYKVNSATSNWTEDQIKLISYYFMSLENKKGITFCINLLSLMDSLKLRVTESDKASIEQTLRFLAGDEIFIDDKIVETLSKCPINMWPKVLESSAYNKDQYRSTEELINLIKSCGNTTEYVLRSLDNVVDVLCDVNQIVCVLKKEIQDQDKLNQFVKNLLACLKSEGSFQNDTENEEGQLNYNIYLSVIALFNNKYKGKMFAMDLDDKSKRCNSIISQDHLHHLLFMALVFFSIQFLLKKELRETQKLSILTFLQSGDKILGQIATGEGKSLIVVSIAIIKSVLKCHSVDIVTSSNVLAQRDAEDYKAVYATFNVGVGNNCSQNVEDRKRAYSNCKVVYGELASFQRDYLLDRFYSKNILGDRKFELIIVDEVDSMLLDQSNNILYLSHEIPGVDKLEPVFIFIWKWLNMPHEDEVNSITVSDLKEAIEFDLFGVIKMENIRDLDLNLTENQAVSTWEYLINEGVIDNKGCVLMEEIDEHRVTVKDRPHCIPEYHLRYLLKNVVERKRQLAIPNHLKTFVKAHLDDWINSAVNALKLEIDVHYVVDVVRTPSNTSRVANIIILDSNTGTDMVNSHWDEGLHQFLQLKHGCRLSLISLKAVFKSNVSYFKLYTLLYGLTGTLGSIHDRDMLKEMYSVEFVTIPTAKPTKLLHDVPQVYQCPESWISSIIKSAYDISEKRSVLVVCETIKDVSLLEGELKTFLKSKENQRTILSYKRDYELVEASDKKPLTAAPGQIILSTNLAGRGTDIKLSNELKNAGGLHVCLTFLPTNSRIEEQAYGRVARNGEPGSSQLIVKSLISTSSISKIIDLKKERDLTEHLRITDIKKMYDSCVQVEEAYFDKFTKCYENLKLIKSPNEDMKNILLKDCLDQWAFWLDSKSRNLAFDSVDSFIDKLSNYMKSDDYTKWFLHIKNPSHLLQLGLKCLKMKQYEVAILMFDRVIKNEPSFCESALYYRPFARAKFEDINKQEVVCDFEKSRKLFKKRVDTTLLASQIVDWLKVHNTKSSLQIESFKEQQENLIHTYMVFIDSIDQVLGSGVDYHQEINDVSNDLIKSEVIIKLKIKEGFTENELNFLEDYGVAPKEMIKFLKKSGSQLIASDFKHRFALPSKELFWKELIEKNILVNEEKYVFIDTNKLKQHQGNNLYQLLVKIILALELEVEPATKNFVWMYDHDYISGMESFSVCRKSSLLAKIGMENYKQLKSQGLFFSNKRATLISTVECIDFKNFNFLSQEHFGKVGISNAVAADILVELENKNVIIKNQSASKIHFCLVMGNIDQINRLKLTKFKAYSEDVRSLLRYHFSFGLAMEELMNLLSSNQPLKIKLNVKPHSAIIHTLIERDILKSTVNCVTDHKAVLECLYRKEMNLDDWRKLFTGIFDENKTILITNKLVESNWLKELTRMNPCNWIEPKFKLNIKGDGKMNKIAQELQNDSNTIEFILLRHAAKTNRKHEYVQFLDAAKGLINNVGTPGFDLKPLRNILASKKEPISELSLFSLNGIDQILQLGEKTWTWKMKRDMFISTLFGLTQVAIGSAFLCMSIVKTGIDDLIYCVNCMFTGIFHWKDYFINKILSLVQILKTPLSKVFSSSFGNNISFSVDSLHSAGRKVIDACKHLTENVISSCNGDLFVSVLSRVVKAVGSTAMSNTLYSVILPKIEYLGNLILNMFDKSIEEILKSHVVIGSAKTLYLTLGEKEANDVINKIYSRVSDEYRSGRNNVWYKVLNNMKQIINTFRGLLSPLSNWDDAMEKVSVVWKLYDMITALFKNKEYTMITNPINHFLDTLDKHMRKEIDVAQKLGTVEGMQALESCSLVDFSSDTIFKIKKCIKNEMFNLINEIIIHPLFHVLNDKLTRIFMDITNKTFNKMFSNKEKSLISTGKGTKVNSTNKIEPGKTSLKKQSYVDKEYDRCLVQLLKTRKNNAVFAKILKENTEIDVSCLAFLCSVIPAVLKKNGINVPNLEITVNRSGVKEVYKTNEGKPASLSVIISTNEGILQNIESNKFLVKGLLETIVLSLLPTDPQVKSIADSFLEKIIMLLQNQSINMDTEVKVRAGTEKSLPPEYRSYQHSHPSGSWSMNPNVDFYVLKDLKPEINLVEPLSDYIASQIDRGFTIALSKLNSHIHRAQGHLKLPFNLALEDFDELKFDIFPPTSSDLNMFHGRAVQYKLIMPFKVKGPKMVNFILTLKLVNQVGKIEPFTPYGPHIVYQVEPFNEAKYMALGVKGHVLIDKKCATGITSSKDCHVAGNLILPTGFKFITNSDTRKAIDVLVLGDLELKYAQHCINKASWEITVFQNLDNARYTMSVISNLFQCFKSPRCIIFHLGTSLLHTHRTPKDIAESVSNIVELLMDHFSGAKIVVFSLHQRKYAEEKYNPTILKINGHLKRYCESNQMIYVDTSRSLRSDHIELNGLDLNKKGQKKLLKYFEEVAQRCVT